MSITTFQKILTANDVGLTGSHQAGMHVPKKNTSFIKFLPSLDVSKKNPSSFFDCLDIENNYWQFRFIYYNNKFHDERGTRDEYRLTSTTKFFKYFYATENEIFQISKKEEEVFYRIEIIKKEESVIPVIKLKGWNQVY